MCLTLSFGLLVIQQNISIKMHEKGFDSKVALSVFLKDTNNKSVGIIENKIKFKVAL